MVLLTGLYLDGNPDRCGEFLECIRRNVANDSLEEIHVFVEDGSTQLEALYPPLIAPKIRLIAHGRRLKYQDLFDYANRCLAGRRVIIANADIFFDHSLTRLDGYDLSGKLLCLSRWDVQTDGTASFFDHPYSQDAWIFRAPVKEVRCDFHLGVPGCDNRLAWEAERVGLATSNPGRSVRAYHLHLSGVRRYSGRERLSGPSSSLLPGFLGTPWLWFVVPCMGRLDDLRQSIGSLLAQPRSNYVLVDYSCADGSGAWVRTNYPQAMVVTVGERMHFHGTEARNRGAAVVDDDGILCFLDADVAAVPGFSEYVLSRIDERGFLIPDRHGPGLDTALICSKSSFAGVGGYDETFLDFGEEGADLRAALHRAGLVERRLPSALLSHTGQHGDTWSQRLVVPDREIGLAIHAAYRRAKSAILDETGGNSVSRITLTEIYRAIARSKLHERGLTPYVSCASVAFRETMGYTIARLEPGVSSHNNDPRPFATIPEALVDRAFTQVVACSVGQVEVEFLASGKLYVLVGTDWEGYDPAITWLRRQGHWETLPLVTTQRGTAFEVWSLIGEVGNRFVLPTQVMLVADHLVRR